MAGLELEQLDHAAALDETRERTLALVAGMTDEQLSRVVTPLLSPLIWDLG
ncbi:MAG: DinB family protein, partial [Actinobacteria bacterium]|nr:DinB family protein [Actinomycetota bacterium]